MDVTSAVLLLLLHALAALPCSDSMEINDDKIWITDRVDPSGRIDLKRVDNKPIEMPLSDYRTTVVKIPEYDSVLPVCKFRDLRPPYEVTWKRVDGHEFTINGRSQKEMKGDYLRLINVTRRHAGDYVCIGSDGINPSKRRYLNLTVFYPPNVHASKPRVGANINSSVILQCVVDSFPVVSTVEWSFANTPHPKIMEDNELVQRQEFWGEIVESLLRVGPIYEGSYGDYICSARNLYGHDSASISLVKKTDAEKEDNSSETGSPAKLAEYVREGSGAPGGSSSPVFLDIILLLTTSFRTAYVLLS